MRLFDEDSYKEFSLQNLLKEILQKEDISNSEREEDIIRLLEFTVDLENSLGISEGDNIKDLLELIKESEILTDEFKLFVELQF